MAGLPRPSQPVSLSPFQVETEGQNSKGMPAFSALPCPVEVWNFGGSVVPWEPEARASMTVPPSGQWAACGSSTRGLGPHGDSTLAVGKQGCSSRELSTCPVCSSSCWPQRRGHRQAGVGILFPPGGDV